jgi:hypothetical protein
VSRGSVLLLKYPAHFLRADTARRPARMISDGIVIGSLELTTACASGRSSLRLTVRASDWIGFGEGRSRSYQHGNSTHGEMEFWAWKNGLSIYELQNSPLLSFFACLRAFPFKRGAFAKGSSFAVLTVPIA